MNYSRRDFIGALGASAAVAAGCVSTCPCERKPRFALQLYSIHKIFWKSPESILSALQAGGFDGVEFYDYGGRTAKELRKLCADAGLTPVGTHLNGDTQLVGDALARTLDFAAEAGFESLVTPHAKRDSADAYRKFGLDMGIAADAADAFGIKVGIHTAKHHFTSVYGGKTAWEIIYGEASPRLQQQIDTGNSLSAGCDVVELLRNRRGRNFSVHAKENTPTIDGVLGVPPTDGGKCVPWNDVIACMDDDQSLRWWIIEAEGRPDSIDPALKCVEVLRGWTT